MRYRAKHMGTATIFVPFKSNARRRKQSRAWKERTHKAYERRQKYDHQHTHAGDES